MDKKPNTPTDVKAVWSIGGLIGIGAGIVVLGIPAIILLIAFPQLLIALIAISLLITCKLLTSKNNTK